MMCLIGGMSSFFGPTIGAAIVVLFGTVASIYISQWQGLLGVIILACVIGFRGGISREKGKVACQGAVVDIQTLNLIRYFGSLHAVNDVSLDIEEGEVRAIIGPNGAARVPCSILSRAEHVLRPAMCFSGAMRSRSSPSYHRIEGARKMFSVSKLFPGLTAFDNIQIACVTRSDRVYDMFSSGKDAQNADVLHILIPWVSVTWHMTRPVIFHTGTRGGSKSGLLLAIKPSCCLMSPRQGFRARKGMT